MVRLWKSRHHHRSRTPQRRLSSLQLRPIRKPVRDLIAQDVPSAFAATTRSENDAHQGLRRRLLSSLVPRHLVEAWLADVPDFGVNTHARQDEEAYLRTKLARLLDPPMGLTRPNVRVVAMVGPTGVGKTTTIAKLATQAHVLENKNVAFVSLDDHRIGSTTQLRAYAQVLDAPLTTVTQAGGLARAVASHPKADLIFVDTAGLTPSRPDDFRTLAQQLQRAGEPLDVHLCVAAATRAEELERLVHLYGGTQPSSLLVTKIDEAVAVGSVFGAREQLGLGFSFVTTGQQIPEDIEPAHASLLLDLLLGETHS